VSESSLRPGTYSDEDDKSSDEYSGEYSGQPIVMTHPNDEYGNDTVMHSSRDN
jgi:hypothetical protein